LKANFITQNVRNSV